MRQKCCFPTLTMFAILASQSSCLMAQRPAADLSQESLEALTQTTVQVSTFARRNGALWKTPGAVYVISRDDIEHSSFTSIPELLRLVPGLQVAQINASTWAISARGFNSIYANKLLVLIDGRTVYSETYSGVPWDQIDLPLANIERIEVIRGPGAAVWGANAANGVINIITRRARSTQGATVSTQAGRVTENGFVRYGGVLGERSQYSAYASAINREPLETDAGRRAYDGEGVLRAGGRLDWQKNWSDLLIASGDLYGGHIKQSVIPQLAIPVRPNNQDKESIAGGYLLTRWEHVGKTHDVAFQTYFDNQSRQQLGTYTRTRAFDLDMQDHIKLGLRNDLVWGSEFRYTADRVLARNFRLTGSDHYQNYLLDGFVQDDIALLRDHLTLTLGSKIQQGTLAGLQIQPSARLMWSPQSTYAVWGAVSQAAVSPSIEDTNITVPLVLGQLNGIAVIATFLGNPAFKPEIVTAYEAGLRRRIGTHFTADVALFFNKTERVQSIGLGNPDFVAVPAPHVNVNLLIGNGFRARSGGVESTFAWNPARSLSFVTNYTWANAHTQQSEPGTVTILDAWSTPRHALTHSATWSFAPGWSTSSFLSYASNVPNAEASVLGDPTGVPSSAVASYTRLDLGISRLVKERMRISAGSTNLLTPRHAEFGSTTGFVVPLLVPRSLFAKAEWSF